MDKKKKITRIDIQGNEEDDFTITDQFMPIVLSVTTLGELVYISFNSKTVNIVRKGKSEALITAPQGWTPMNVW